MIALALEPFAYDYMARAIWVSALVGAVCGFLSCYLVLKGWSLMGDALAHAVVPGVAVAYALSAPYALGAFVSALLAALGIALGRRLTRLREDAVIGVVFTSFLAAGLLLISLNPTSVNVQTIVLGNILAISDEDVKQVAIVAAVSLAALLVRWKDLMLVIFDEAQARAMGLSPERLRILFFMLLSACAVAALQTVGAVLVIALVVTPGATAYLLTDNFGRMIAIAVALGAGCSALGAYVSYFIDGATGGCIVVLQTLAFLAAFWFAPQARQARRAAPGARGRIEPMNDVLAWLLAPFAYEFMVRGLIVASLVGAACALLSCYLVLKGWSLMGDAVSHAVLPGIVAATVVGAPIIVGAFVAGLACALSVGYLKTMSRVKEDAVMGVVFSGMFALGLVMFVKVDSDQHLTHVLFGDMLGVQWRDVVETALITAPAIVFTVARRRDLLLYCFDPAHARAVGLSTARLHFALLVLLALTIVASLKAVGVVLVIAMLVTPGATAFLLTSQFDRMLMISVASAVSASVTGTIASLHLDAATGPLIVVVQAGLFLLALAWATLKRRRPDMHPKAA